MTNIVEEARRLLDGITQGILVVDFLPDDTAYITVTKAGTVELGDKIVAFVSRKSDAELFANAPRLLRELIAEIERLEKEIALLEKENETMMIKRAWDEGK